ncbi:MAG: hypothetical protein GTO45_30515 [Candidatus Aminicenantes bacterium]|nr:hypothetical protein [Candidatus Aminicenantes bacterium]NIM83127.1 hypothetical protein [Candidatus Aminicenantes bacterium]NIN22506.1 hypothetical protein [Candidatus Aminicenantes bacterium]NIN46274.1 hypothetical protein [Candidatus Aminicenantes bacterium]NIN89112.1 hypothetical protein [Candidatus Aminicenantes bacterium]
MGGGLKKGEEISIQKHRSNTGPFGDHLRRFVWRLQAEKGLRDSLHQILRRGVYEFETHFLRLRSAGLVKGETRDSVQMVCHLYEDYFRKHLVSNFGD